jgi:hypothetical protein
MPFFAGQDRDSLRRAWQEAWRKHRAGAPLEPLEAQLADVILLHPEYQEVLAEGPGSLARDWAPEGGQSNPYLHMGLHLAVRDSIATDRPSGIRAVYERLLLASGSPHEAEHVLLDCLGETLWEAQGARCAPDENAFLERCRIRAGLAR